MHIIYIHRIYNMDHVPTTTPDTSFVTVAHIELRKYLPFLLLANENRYANHILNMYIRWWQNMYTELVYFYHYE